MSLFGCRTAAPLEPQAATEVERLAKLCRVWGYVKYTHPAFLLGQRDWDEELLALIPQVRELETHEEVNALLHDWFVGLGEIDYGASAPVTAWANAAEEDKLVVADTSWTTDAAYLGNDLAADLGRLTEIPNIRRTKAPVTFGRQTLLSGSTYPIFSNEKNYLAMDYSDSGYRLLSLFRVWNALEYYFPYHALLDQDWESYLDEFIPRMLETDNLPGYLLTLFSLMSALHDNHATLGFGGPYVPFSVTEAEGKLVVSGTAENCPLAIGDIILALDGESIDVIADIVKEYLACSRDEVFLSRNAQSIFSFAGLSSSKEQVEVTVLRDGTETSFLCDWVTTPPSGKTPQEYYQILEGNIGLINPEKIPRSVYHTMMEDLRNTDGLIIDLRQYPGDELDISSYFTTESAPAFINASPSVAAPGTYIKEANSVGYKPGNAAQGVYYYDKPVVVLIDEFTQSAGEWAAWTIRKGENVVLMGQNSIGALNRIAELPVPGTNGINFQFTAIGATLDDGTQLQRVGLTPDIYVSRTIQGVSEGRDEQMEAAVQYLMDKNQNTGDGQ